MVEVKHYISIVSVIVVSVIVFYLAVQIGKSISDYKVDNIEEKIYEFCDALLSNDQSRIDYILNTNELDFNSTCKIECVERLPILTIAVMKADLSTIKKIIDHVNIGEIFLKNRYYDIYDTATSIALEYGQIDIFEFLLEKQKDSISEIINPTLFNGLTYHDPSDELLEHLTSKNTLLYNARDSNGTLWYNIKDEHNSPLLCNLLFNEKYNALKYLLKFEDIDIPDECILYSEEYKSVFNDDDYDYFLKYDMSLSLCYHDAFCMSPVLYCSYDNPDYNFFGPINSIKCMSEKRLDLDNMLNERYSLIEWAIYFNNFDITKLILSDSRIKNFDLTSDSYERNLLFKSIQNNNVEIVKLLLEREDIDINHIVGENTALSIAVRNNNVEIVKLLLEREDIRLNQIIDKYNNTILSIAMRLHLNQQENVFSDVYLYKEDRQLYFKNSLNLNVKNTREIDYNQDYSEIIELLVDHPQIFNKITLLE